nr:DUF2142 domain-containing protein [Thermoflexales bacterium]
MPMIQSWRGRSISNWFNIRVIIAAYLILGAVYSVASPIFEGPDESNHFFVIQSIHETGRLPVQDSATSTLYRQEGSQPPLYYLAGAMLISGIDVSAASEYVRSNPQVNIGSPGSPNNKNHYIHTSREDFPYHDTPLAVHLLRGLSIGLGLITISMTYALARLLFPDRKSVALVAAMLVAFNPQFIYLSAAVNNDNAINALAACSLYLLARLWRGDRSWRVLLALAVSLGLAVIAKLGGLILLGFSVVVIGYLAVKQRDWRWGGRSVFVVGAAVAVIGGWWFIRNVQLYGDPTGLSAMLKLLDGRTTEVTVAQMISELPSLWFSFWGVFGWFNIQLPDWAFGIYAVVVVGALLSGGLALRRVREYDWRQLEPILALAGWVGLVFVGLIRYEMMLKAFQGRLLFSAMPALAILLALGAMRWLERSGSRGLIGFAVVLFAIAAWTPVGVIAPAYAQPLKISLADIPGEVKRIDIDFNDTVRLIGGYVEPRTIQTGDFVTIKLYWQALRQP